MTDQALIAVNSTAAGLLLGCGPHGGVISKAVWFLLLVANAASAIFLVWGVS